MKHLTTTLIGLGITLAISGCGHKKHQPEPTVAEQQLAKFDAMVKIWKDIKSKNKDYTYSFGYYREGYRVDYDVIGDKIVCRQKTWYQPEGRPNIREVGEEINSNDWAGAKAYTLDEIHQDCRPRVAKDPYLPVGETMWGYPYWCSGAFDLEIGEGVDKFSTSKTVCDKPLPE